MARLNPVSGQRAVLAFMQDKTHLGQVWTGPTVCRELGISETEADPIGKALATLAKKGLVERIGSGQYVFRGTKPIAAAKAAIQNDLKIDSLLVVVGYAEDGRVLVRCEQGRIYAGLKPI